MADKTARPTQAKEDRKAGDPGQVEPVRVRRKGSGGRLPGESKIADNPLARAFGVRLRELRLRADIAQDSLADLSGLHRTEISLIERAMREPRLGTILKLAGGLGIQPAELVKGVATWRPEGPDAKELMRERAVRWAETGSVRKHTSVPPGRPRGKITAQSVAALFGRRLRELREGGDLSQEELATLTGIHRTEISTMERGVREPRIATVLKLASGVGVDPAALVEALPALDPAGNPKKVDEAPRALDAGRRDTGTMMPVLTMPEARRSGSGMLLVAPEYEIGLAESALAGRSFSGNVISLREERGWTQRELANRAGIARTEITSVELGARLPPADVVISLAAGFELEPADLLHDIPSSALPPDMRTLQGASAIADAAVEDEADVADRLAGNLLTLRRRRGLSQSDLATTSGVPRTTIAGIEEKTRMPQLVTLGKLAGALAVPLSLLIDELLPDDDGAGVR